MSSVIFALIGVAMIGACVTSLVLQWRVGPIALLVALICAGLAYDNIVLAIGRLLGYGDALMALNAPRFWIHALVVPLLIVVAGLLVRRLGVEQAGGRNIMLGGAALVAMLILVGVVTDIVRLDLQPKDAGDALRYVNAAAEGAPIPVVITILAVLVLGVAALRYARVYWLLAGALVMLVTAIVGGSILWVGNLGELALMGGVIATMAVVGDREAEAAQVGEAP